MNKEDRRCRILIRLVLSSRVTEILSWIGSAYLGALL